MDRKLVRSCAFFVPVTSSPATHASRLNFLPCVLIGRRGRRKWRPLPATHASSFKFVFLHSDWLERTPEVTCRILPYPAPCVQLHLAPGLRTGNTVVQRASTMWVKKPSNIIQSTFCGISSTHFKLKKDSVLSLKAEGKSHRLRAGVRVGLSVSCSALGFLIIVLYLCYVCTSAVCVCVCVTAECANLTQNRS